MDGGRIRQLDEAVANQIAAGEVVERPASVVKELVENALDAESTRIRVEVEEGGTRRIRVTDDGFGMSPRDAELCLSRHATSKIRSVEDLEAVRTLGFRGEAVPSIASVSRFCLTTCERGADTGTRVVVEGGHVAEVREVGAPAGTTIDVADLFFNVPARKKFLKRAATELSHISEGLVRLAMCRPQVGFRLATENKVLLDVPPGVEADPRGRLGRILGAKVAERLHPVLDDGYAHPVRVTGFVAEPGLSERWTKGLYTFVNGRFVRDRTIQHAVQDAYRTLLERGRYPVVVLFIELDPSRFDVNVHPQKTEVRFAHTGDIHRAVTGALSRTLAAQPWLRGAAPASAAPATPAARTYRLDRTERAERAFRTERAGRVDRTEAPARDPAPAGRPEQDLAPSGPDGFLEHAARANRARQAAKSPGLQRGKAAFVPRLDIGHAFSRPAAPPEDLAPPPLTDEDRPPSLDSEIREPTPPYRGASEPSVPSEPRGPEPTSLEARWSGKFSSLSPVGQVLGTYLVCQGPGRMVIIDQHAAHERVTFQRLRAQAKAGKIAVQPLLIPLELDLGARAAALTDMQDTLSELGFAVDQVDGEWQVKAAPALLAGARLGRLVADLVDELMELPASMAVSERMDALMSCAACHGSVRAQDRLHKEEIRALLAQMDEIDFGAFCPHGRPVFVELDAATLGRMFHRS